MSVFYQLEGVPGMDKTYTVLPLVTTVTLRDFFRLIHDFHIDHLSNFQISNTDICLIDSSGDQISSELPLSGYIVQNCREKPLVVSLIGARAQKLLQACQMHEFRKYLETASLKGDLLIFDEKCTSPIDKSSDFSLHHNMVLVRPQLWHFLCIFEYIYRNKIIQLSPSLLISGPPGSGKSWSGLFFLWYYVGVRGNEQDVVYVSCDNSSTWIFQRDGIVVPGTFPCTAGNTPELNFHDTILIYDCKAGGQEAEIYRSRAIVLSSANSLNKTVRKTVAAHLNFISPSYTEFSRAYQLFKSKVDDEYENAKVDHMWYFEHSGASLRNMMKQPEAVLCSLIAAAQRVNLDNLRSICLGNVDTSPDAPSSVFVTFLKPESLPYLLETPVEMSHQDFKEVFARMMSSDKSAIINLMDAYGFSNVEWNICSEYVYDLIQKCSEDEIEDFDTRFMKETEKSQILGAMRGNMFQSRLPKLLGRSGCAYEVRKLRHIKSQRDEAPTSQTATFQAESLKYVKTTDVREILRTCTDPKTLYVINDQLPAFDMFNPPNVFIKTTCVRTLRHPINFEAAVKICAHCAAHNCRAVFLFAVPSDTIELWRYSQPFSGDTISRIFDDLSMQNRAVVENLDQYTLCIVNL